MTPPSTSRPTRSDLSSSLLMRAGEGRLRPAEVLGEELADLVRVAVDRLLAQRTRSGFSFSTSALSARATRSPSSWSSVASTRIARSAPVASAARSVVSVSFGPNVTTTTSPRRAFGFVAVLGQAQRRLDGVLVERVRLPLETGRLELACVDLHLVGVVRVGDALERNEDLHRWPALLERRGWSRHVNEWRFSSARF